VYVSRLRVENIRGFRGARAVDLDFRRPDGGFAGWTVLAGRNGSGKTSLLRALAVPLIGHEAVYALAPDFRTWLNGDHALIDLGILDGDPPEWNPAVELDLVPATRETPKAVRTTWTEDRRLVAGILRGPLTFAAGYGPFRRMSHVLPDPGIRTPDQERAARFTTLFDSDAALSEAVGWLIGLHLRRLEQREGAAELLEDVLALLGDGLLPDGHRVVRVDSDGLWVRRGSREFAMRELSDGYQTVTALVLDLVRHLHTHYGGLRAEREGGEGGGISFPLAGVVLIDEIDAHLHVSWQQRIGEWLKRHFPRVQFIVTTHSPYICQAADPGGLIRLPGPDEEAAPRVVDEELYHRVVYGSGDDAVLTELFGLDSPYSARAEALRREVIGLEERVLAGEADDAEVERYRRLSGLLSSSLSARVDEVAARLRDGGER
jgi:energy-coupling factor transporter ATP-binding protein EcfA2